MALVLPLPLPPVSAALIVIILPLIAVLAVIAFATVPLVPFFAAATTRVAVFVFGFAGSWFTSV